MKNEAHFVLSDLPVKWSAPIKLKVLCQLEMPDAMCVLDFQDMTGGGRTFRFCDKCVELGFTGHRKARRKYVYAVAPAKLADRLNAGQGEDQ